MAALNFYKDNSDIIFHMENMDLAEIIRLKEDDFSDKTEFLDAPSDVEDARDNFTRVLNLVGEIAGEYISPDSAEVDETGATFEKGEVKYAKATQEAIERLVNAELMGLTLPRKYGGLNLPKTIYSMAIELISRADASLMTIFGLQELSDTICKFGTEDQRQRFLNRFCTGEVLGAMALTEPDAGSDLGSAQLKAYQDDGGQWYLNGVKRFITNGCAKVLLVMARTEGDIEDARGLSLFIYERDDNMMIRSIESKLGIHGSPTCELQFNNAKAELLGQRKRGLIKYAMSLMNGARLGVSAQAVGIAEEAYREAQSYAAKRIQFNRTINCFPQVYEMLTDMKVSIEASRCLLYEVSRIVDIKEGLEKRTQIHPETKPALRGKLRQYTDYESLFTPILKCFTTEIGNRICYHALQVHGGVGYTQGFKIERLCQDMRITSIYEGTTQMQIIAAIGGLFKGIASERLKEYENTFNFSQTAKMYKSAKEFKKQLECALSFVHEKNDHTYQEYHAGRLVDMATDTIISYLLCIDALKSEKKKKIGELFISKAKYRIKSNLEYILSDDRSLIELHQEIITAY